MAIINVKPDEFADLVVAYLLDMTRDESLQPDNERFKKFMKLMGERGLKQASYSAFLDMNTTTRIKYKRLKKSFDESGTANRIEISDGETPYINEEEEFDRELCKKIFKTIKEYRFKNPSKILREDRIDKIIDYCIEKQKKQQEEQQNG